MSVPARFIIVPSLVAALAASAPAAPAALPRELDARINRALVYLAQQQKPDGSFDDGGNPPPAVALTSLSLMAYLSCGHTPDEGRFGLTVRNAVDYLLKQTPAEGSYFGRNQGSRMYGHAIATLALAEVYGLQSDAAQRRKARAALDGAVGVILSAQRTKKKDPAHEGGWRYEATESDDSDLSVSAWCALALRAAQNAGITVPRQAVDRAVDFVLSCHHAPSGGFAYQPRGEPSVAMTGAASLTLRLLDAGARPPVAQADEYLQKQLVNDQTKWFYYAIYYSTQAAHQAGGATWVAVWRNNYDQLSRRQLADGSFRPAPGEPGATIDANRARAVYATSLSVLAMSVPYKLLPIYQK